jgi:glycosyltransferase involved in cell wall biosynthesis
LDSLKGLADEIVVVDSGSSDRTREIAAAAGARVFQKVWAGYGPQKQFALEQSTGDWVLNVDADERVTASLKDEILQTLSSVDPAVAAYNVPFRLFVLRRRLRFGRGARETHIRLFRRGKALYPARLVHEGIQVDGPVGRLRGEIEHHSYGDFSEYLRKMDEYTALLSAKKRAAGARFSFWMHARLPWELYRAGGIYRR